MICGLMCSARRKRPDLPFQSSLVKPCGRRVPPLRKARTLVDENPGAVDHLQPGHVITRQGDLRLTRGVPQGQGDNEYPIAREVWLSQGESGGSWEDGSLIDKTCYCGSEMEKKAINREQVVVTIYWKCKACGHVVIESDSTGQAVKRAYHKNKEILRRCFT